MRRGKQELSVRWRLDIHGMNWQSWGSASARWPGLVTQLLHSQGHRCFRRRRGSENWEARLPGYAIPIYQDCSKLCKLHAFKRFVHHCWADSNNWSGPRQAACRLRDAKESISFYLCRHFPHASFPSCQAVLATFGRRCFEQTCGILPRPFPGQSIGRENRPSTSIKWVPKGL
jgi:hypothetical protein